VGAKADLYNGALTFDGSVYRIDWKDIQLLEYNFAANLAFYANASGARSQGFEISSTARPFSWLSLSGFVSYDDAKLTKDFPPDAANAGIFGLAGDRLPYSQKWSGNLSAEVTVPTSAGRMYGGSSISFVDKRLSEFSPDENRDVLPAYAKVDAHLGLRRSAWTFELYVNNVFNKRGVLAAGAGSGAGPSAVYFITPRNGGLTVTRSF
jgi:outer membrane receptor protein involved in Fe transport